MSQHVSHTVTVLAAIVLAVVAVPPHADVGGVAAPTASAHRQDQLQAPVQTSKADARPVSGEWRSSELFDNQPRATVIVEENAGALAGTLTMLGMTRGTDDRATVRVPFRGGVWNGTVLTFETMLPDNEGKARWALHVTAPGKATLGYVSDDDKPVEDGPVWEMSRR